MRGFTLLLLFAVVLLIAGVTSTHDGSQRLRRRQRYQRHQERRVHVVHRSRRPGRNTATTLVSHDGGDDDDAADNGMALTRDDVETTTSMSRLSETLNQFRHQDDVNITSVSQEASNRDNYRNRVRAKNSRILHIQKQIIQKLGMFHKPDIASVPRNTLNTITEVYESHLPLAPVSTPVNNNGNTRHRTYQALKPSCELPRNSDHAWTDEAYFRLYFNIAFSHSAPGYENVVTLSRLRLYKTSHAANCGCQGDTQTQDGTPRTDDHDPSVTDGARPQTGDENMYALHTEGETPTSPDRMLTIQIYYYSKPVRTDRKLKKKLALQQEVSESHVGWMTFNVTSTTALWYKRPPKNLGFEINVVDDQGRALDPFHIFQYYNCSELQNETLMPPIPVGMPMTSDTDVIYYNLTYPHLDILISQREVRSRRYKRHLEGSPSCVLEKGYLSLADYDWIVQPQMIEAGFCSGTCAPMALSRQADDDVEPLSVNQCCGPTEVRPLDIIHFDQQGHLTITQLDNFIVTKCGCT